MLKERASRRFRALILLACFLSILAMASDGGNSRVKAQTHPVCATLGAMTSQLGGTVNSCVASGTLGIDLDLEMQSEFIAILPAETFGELTFDLLGADAVIETSLSGGGSWTTDVSLHTTTLDVKEGHE